jgi:hypothetical protein
LRLLHNARGGGRTWRELGIVESQVPEVNAVIEHGSKELWAFISEERDRAVSDGFSRRTSGDALARTPIVPEIRGPRTRSAAEAAKRRFAAEAPADVHSYVGDGRGQPSAAKRSRRVASPRREKVAEIRC